MARLLDKYRQDVYPQLAKEFALANPMQVPRVTKITCNIGVGEASREPKLLDTAVEQLANITGQRPVVRRARKSIAAFKLRAGMPVGVMVTLRRERMYEFLDRLISTALPRVRDFHGVSTSAFDGRGNYTLGIRDLLVFPEVDYQKIEGTMGLNITFSTTAPTDDQARALLAGLGMPFQRR
ncbi:MAG: 50S ribosomal protein L5 [Acidobacteria bacterium]|jgi:large subunit ribosomal protein L5|nr:50S ribosomal protein L5 [Acidobacteriota bacterium]